MLLTESECEKYQHDGYLFVENYLDTKDLEKIDKEYDRLKQLDLPSRVMENESGMVRAMHGCHLESRFFKKFIRDSRFISPAEQIIDDDVYLYQFKINCKEAFGGDVWRWHQDYIFWKNEDGMVEPQALNILIFLDDVTEFNGPLVVIPESHKKGLVDVSARNSNEGEGDWEENVSAYLKYTLEKDVIEDRSTRAGMQAPKGPRGSALFFHPNIMHGSVPNISPANRRLLILTYNGVSNAPDPAHLWRPEFLVGRDTTPLQAL